MNPSETYLIVDDDTIFRERLAQAIRTRGHEVTTADSLESAGLAVRSRRFDKAIVDLKIPGSSGLEITRELLERQPEMKILILTGYGSIATAIEAIRVGALDYLAKPADADQILAAFQGDKPASSDASDIATPSLSRVEWEHIQRVLADHDGNITHAAQALGIHRRSLQRKLGKYPSPR